MKTALLLGLFLVLEVWKFSLKGLIKMCFTLLEYHNSLILFLLLLLFLLFNSVSTKGQSGDQTFWISENRKKEDLNMTSQDKHRLHLLVWLCLHTCYLILLLYLLECPLANSKKHTQLHRSEPGATIQHPYGSKKESIGWIYSRSADVEERSRV